MSKLLMVLILAIPLSGSWKDLSLEERYDWVVRHFGEYEAERLERMNLLEDDWLFEGRQPESLNVRIVGRWPFGPTFEVTGDTIRNLVFQGSGSGVRILDISNMPNVNELSRIAAPYAGLIRGLAIKDTILVVLQGADGFSVYGITNPANPSELARIFIGQWLNDCVIQDSLLYIAGDDSLRIYNLKDPRNPAFLGGCGLPNEGHGVYVQGSYAYLACLTAGLRIYDVSDPGNPQEVGFWDQEPTPYDLFVKGNHAYVAALNYGLRIINVSNPSSPWEEGYVVGTCGDAHEVQVLGWFAFVAGGFDIVDVSDSSNPTIISHLNTPGWNFGVWVNRQMGSGAYAFAADHFAGLAVIDISNPVSPVQKDTIGEADDAKDILVVGGYVFLANDKAGVKIIEISNPQLPVEIAQIDTVSAECHLDVIGIKDTVLFISGWWGNANKSIFRSFSIADPSIPYELDRRQTHSYGHGSIAIAESIAFFADVAVEAINISDPANLDTFRSYLLPPTALAYDIFAKDSLVYVPAGYAGFRIISYGDPWNPYEIGSFPIGFASGIWVIDTLAYLGGDENGLVVLSVADPTSPYQVGSANFRCLYVRVVDSLAYMDGGGYFRILNVLDPTNITEVGRHSFGGYQLWADSNYIYCACNERGIVIYEILEPGINEREIKGPQGNPLIPTIIRSGARLRFSPKSRVEVRDAVGRLIKETKVGEEVILEGLSTGVYFLIEKQGITTKVYKVVVIK